MAFAQAHRILDWHENLSNEEIPPRWMWHLDEELDDWFDDVEADRKLKNGATEDGDEMAPGMVQNELARDRR